MRDGSCALITSTLDALRSVVHVLELTSCLTPPEKQDRRVQPDPCIFPCLEEIFVGLLPRLLASEETYAVNRPVRVEELISRMQNGVTVKCAG